MPEPVVKTYRVVCQSSNGGEETVDVQGTVAEFDEDSQRLTIKNKDQLVGSFVRVLRWVDTSLAQKPAEEATTEKKGK